MVIWCPDWPVIAAEIVDGYPAQEPVAVMHANRVLATSPAAREEGVRRGLRKREAQGRCPHLIVLEHDPARDMRAFEPVLMAVEALAPGVETLRPGACALAARGPARYYGGEEAAAERLVEHVAQQCGVEAQAGIAEGTFAAGLAARAGVIVPAGETAGFLADLSVSALGRPALADLLRRLGIHTLAEFAALPGGDVLARFGFDAALAHRLAGGRDERPLAPRKPPADLDVAETFDEPVDRVDAAAFAARALAERLHDRLASHGLACTRLAIEATTERGEELVRTWRHDGLLGVGQIADRLRWQLDGWLRGRNHRPTAGIVRLRLVPEGVVEHLGLQPGLWGEAGEERDRAHRALTRVQGLLGPDAVLTAMLDGGRADQRRIRLVAFGDERVAQGVDAPWPGRLPAPSPATVHVEPLPAEVVDADGGVVTVSGRLVLSAVPARIRMDKEPQAVEIVAWAGPWPVDERWWDEDEARRCARFQLRLADERAVLAVLENGVWRVEALYD
ncbi:DNA polymerase Y family protein [Dactylosporangium sucinum]|uniref:DNA polymerase n=1 Tax=Dactylosporangium sucinum TaxID=1424081 RepID=A0A917UDZ6_9ACTN|nr:DNA polymerase Y family protein [Dactylosporangium sucinum]GGM80466.1 DNA polymerase [Dactylosporangium sucinum]